MISNDEKNVFLQDLEEEQLEKKISQQKKNPEKISEKKKKGLGATALFASFSVFFIFMILLMVFVLSLSGTGNPVFKTFGIEPYQIKSFLQSLLNKSFLIIIVVFLLSTAVGIFKGYSTPKEDKKGRRKSFVFSSVAGALIFLSLISWGGAYAFIDKFVTTTVQDKNAIIVLDSEKYGDILVAPLDITFSIDTTLKKLISQGYKIESVKWSSDGGKNFYENNDWESHNFHFTTKGVQKIVASVLMTDGTERLFTRTFKIDKATFAVPNRIHAKKRVTFDASKVVEGGKRYLWDFDGDGTYEKSSSRGTITHTFKNPGTFSVELRVQLPQDSFQVFKREIRVYAESEKSLVANITSDQEFSGEAPFAITFSGTESFSDNEQIIDYDWLIGKEKKRRKGEEVFFTFEKPGDHPVRLTVTNKNGEHASKEILIKVLYGNTAPKTVISTIPRPQKKNRLEGQLPFEVRFSGEKSTDADQNIISYTWIIEDELGKKEKFSGSEITHVFREEGSFSVELKTSDQKGASNAKKIQVIVREPTVFAIAHASPETGNAPLIVSFDGSESSCKLENCNVTGFEWDFSDGSPVKRTGSKISHRFEKAGTYPVSMTVHTNTGDQNTSLTYINVSEAIFKSCFEPSRSKGIFPVKITFDPSCSEGEISEYKWDFGDGKISRIKRPSHTFRQAGTFQVTSHIIDKNGRVSKSTQSITIREE